MIHISSIQSVQFWILFLLGGITHQQVALVFTKLLEKLGYFCQFFSTEYLGYIYLHEIYILRSHKVGTLGHSPLIICFPDFSQPYFTWSAEIKIKIQQFSLENRGQNHKMSLK